MKKRKNKFLFFLFIPAFIIAEENFIYLGGKKISFFMDKKTAAFYLENPYPREKEFKTLLFKDNPPTSFLMFQIKNNLYKFSDNVMEVENFNFNDSYINLVLKKEGIVFNVYFIITNVIRKNMDNSIIIYSEIVNKNTNSTRAGIRFLLDTVYGENKKNPVIYTSTKEKIEYDKIVTKELVPDFFFTGYADPLESYFYDGLYIYPSINDFKPEKVIIGNWKKLYQMKSIFIPEPKARFKYNPYSNPDTAICIFYEFILKPDEKIGFGCALSIEQIPKDKLKISSFLVEEVSNAVSKETLESKQPQEMAEKLGETKVSKTPVETNQESLLLDTQLKLLEKLLELVDKIEAKFFQTNEKSAGYIERKTEPELTPQAKIFIQAEEKKVSAKEENLSNRVSELKEEYEKKLKAMEESYNKEKPATKPTKVRDKKKEIEKTIREVDSQLYLLEKLIELKGDLKDFSSGKIKEIEDKIKKLEEETGKQ